MRSKAIRYIEQIEKIRIKETAFLELVSEISTEFDLSAILVRVVKETTTMLNAERATIFLHDPATGTLFSGVVRRDRAKSASPAISALPARSSPPARA